MDELGWDVCDVILVSGDAFVDHPSFGTAIIARVLEAQGFRVGIIPQPTWDSADSFRILGKPALFFGISAGNMDSMVNKYTAERKIRSEDSYSPDGQGNKRPDRASIVYSQRVREAFAGTAILLGGTEAAMRRIAYYDYWSDKIRKSVLLDSKADLLIYGNGERAIVEIAHRLTKGENIKSLDNIRGTVLARRDLPDWMRSPNEKGKKIFLTLPSFDEVSQDKIKFQDSNRIFYRESNPYNARILVQDYGYIKILQNPPSLPLSSAELDRIYELPYQRRPHSIYAGSQIPAFEMIRHSITIMRGCFGGCSFCSLTVTEGRIIQKRSEESIIREIQRIRDTDEKFNGHISDLGGPSANMYAMGCSDKDREKSCKKLSCVYPDICKYLKVDHKPLIKLYRKARNQEGIKKVFIASGLRYDLALQSPEYIRELVEHHTGGYLKVAPEHVNENALRMMMKPGIEIFEKFQKLFYDYSKQIGKEQYLIPYFISAFPGVSIGEMIELMDWLKKNGYRPKQVQSFLPTPLTLASSMYYSGRSIFDSERKIHVPKNFSERRDHKILLQYFKAENHTRLKQLLFAHRDQNVAKEVKSGRNSGSKMKLKKVKKYR